MTGEGSTEQEHAHPALEQPTRRRIYRRIGEKPGMNWNQLKRSLGVSTGVLSHHLDRLEAEELIVRLEGEDDREVIHFQAEDAALGEDERTRVLFGNAATRRVAMLILENPEITREGLSEKLGIGVPGVKYHLEKLDEYGLIRETSGIDDDTDDADLENEAGEDGEGEGETGPRTYAPAERLEAWGEDVGHAFGLM